MARPVLDLVERIGFDRTVAPELWTQALTHKSAESVANYERLEFLGDAVLKLVISQWLYDRAPHMPEGEMTKVRARVVSDEVLARVAVAMELGPHLVLGPSEKRSAGRTKVGTLASAFEAMLGVVHQVHGYAAADAFLRTWLGPEYETALEVGGQDNYKALLQEHSQKLHKTVPEYRLVERSGPDHAAKFTVAVSIKGVGEAEASGSSKQEAETLAAAAFLRKFA